MSYSKGFITIPNVTGDVVINVVTEPVEKVNLYSINNVQLNKYYSASTGATANSNGCYIPDLIPFDPTEGIQIIDLPLGSDGQSLFKYDGFPTLGSRIIYYDSNGNVLGGLLCKPTIITTSEPVITITLDENTIMQCETVTVLTISVPENVGSGYITDISFTSGSTATNVTMPDVGLCSGDDCIDNVFTPLANKRYNASFWYDGTYVVGAVQGNAL